MKKLRVLYVDDNQPVYTVAPASRPMHLSLLQLYSDEQAPTSAPYSIEVLAGHVRERAPGWSVSMDVLDSRTPNGPEDYVTQIVSRKTDVVGISVAQGTHALVLSVLDQLYLKTASSAGRPQVILGNSLPTYRPQPYLDRYPGLVIVRGFGEEALLHLLERIQRRLQNEAMPAPTAEPLHLADYLDVPNLTMVYQGEVHSTPVDWPRHYAIPAWVDVDRYFARVEASRGCHYDACTFCTRPPREKGQPRWLRYPIHKIAATVQRLKDEGVERFTFCDEDFIGDDPDGCLELAECFEKFGGAPAFSFSTRADNVVDLDDSEENNARRRSLFQRLKSVGLKLVFVGLESFCDAQLKRYGKRVRAEGNIRAVEMLRSLGLEIEAGFIMFDPLMTLEDLQENIDNVDRHEMWRITSQTLSRMDIQEATPMLRWLDRAGLVDAYDEEQMTYSYRFADAQVAHIANLCEAWKNETDYAYRLVRNAQRMALFESFPNEIMLAAKKLNFNFVKDVTMAACRNPNEIRDVIEQKKIERMGVMQVMLQIDKSSNIHVELVNRLSHEISGFLGVRA